VNNSTHSSGDKDMKKQLAILIPALGLFFAASVSASGGGGGYSTGGK